MKNKKIEYYTSDVSREKIAQYLGVSKTTVPTSLLIDIAKHKIAAERKANRIARLENTLTFIKKYLLRFGYFYIAANIIIALALVVIALSGFDVIGWYNSVR